MDRHIIHDGYTNIFSFVLNEKPIILVPSSLRQAYDDQVRLKKENYLKKESESSRLRGNTTKNEDKKE